MILKPINEAAKNFTKITLQNSEKYDCQMIAFVVLKKTLQKMSTGSQ